jgi:cell division protein FtsL
MRRNMSLPYRQMRRTRERGKRVRNKECTEITRTAKRLYARILPIDLICRAVLISAPISILVNNDNYSTLITVLTNKEVHFT